MFVVPGILLALLGGPQVGEGQSVALRIEPSATGYVVRLRDPGGLELLLDGATLSIVAPDGVPERKTVRFTEVEREPASWVLRSGTVGEHSLRLDITRTGERSFGVRLVDELDVRTSVQELSLAWRARTRRSISTTVTRLPYVVEDSQDIAPDTTWALPGALIFEAGSFVAVEPTTAAIPRRMPFFLTTRPRAVAEPTTSTSHRDLGVEIVHGLGRNVLRGGNLFALRGNVVPAVDRRLVLDHEIRFGTARDADRAHALVARERWKQVARADDPHEAPRVPMREALAGSIRQAAEKLLPIEGPLRSNGFHCIADTPGELLTGLVAVRHDTRSRPLAVALAIYGEAQRRGDTALMERARGCCRLFLDSPDRGGLFRTRARVDTKAGRVTWEFDDQGCYSSQDCASVAMWLLRWSDLDPQLRVDCMARARRLGDFFVRNRQGDGSIPSRFDPELDGRRDALWVESAETATCGLFLLELWRRTRDGQYLAAAADAHAIVAQARDKGTLLDREAIRLLREPRTLSTRVLSTNILIDAAMLAFGLADAKGRPEYRAQGLRWLDLLLPLQQHWSPPFFGARLQGGFARSNFDVMWSDVSATRAALALYHGWRTSREGQLLSRASAALRAPFALARTTASGHAAAGWGVHGQNLPANSGSVLRGLASAAIWLDEFLAITGDAIVDLETLDAYAFTDCTLREVSSPVKQQVNLRLESEFAQLTPIRVRFVRGTGTHTIVCNGRALEPMDPEALRTGVQLETVPEPKLDFRPQPGHARSRDLDVRARLDGVAADGDISAIVELKIGEAIEPVSLRVERSAENPQTVMLVGTLSSALFRRDGFVDIRVRADLESRSCESPWRSVRLGAGDVADCADDDERWLAETGRSIRAPFPDGTGNGRFLADEQRMTYRLPVDPGALAVRLLLRFAGRGSIVADGDGRTVHEFVTPPQSEWHEESIEILDRTLWESGHLALTFVASGASFGIDWIDFEARGRGSPANTIGQRIVRPLLSRLHVGVLPTVSSAAPVHDREAVRLAIFADDSYRTTPAPSPRRTTGSFAAWMHRLSRGKLNVTGSVANWRACPVPDRADSLTAWLETAFAVHEVGDTGDVDCWILPHTGLPEGLASQAILRDPVHGKPVLMLPATDSDRALLPLANTVRLFFEAFVDRDIAARPDDDVFARLVLNRLTSKVHRPPPPLSLQLHALGWTPIYRASTRNHVAISMPPATDGGFVLTLPVPGLSGRGRITLERRSPAVRIDRSDWRDGGILGFWELPPERARIVRAESETAVAPSLVPLRPDPWRPLLERATTPPPVRDQRITSIWGEECWRILRQRSGRDAEDPPIFDLEFLGRKLLTDESRLRAASRATGRGWVPLTIDGPRGDSGHVSRIGKSSTARMSIAHATRAESRVRLTWDGLDLARGARLVGALHAPKVRMRAILEGDGLARALPWLESSDETRSFLLTLPSAGRPGARLVLEFETRARSAPPSELSELMLWPLAMPEVELTALAQRNQSASVVHATDDAWYGPTLVLGAATTHRIELPVRFPDQPTLLRICGTFASDEARGAERRLDIRFRDARGASNHRMCEGIRITASKPELVVIDPGPMRGRTGILVIEASGDGPPVYLIETSLRYL